MHRRMPSGASHEVKRKRSFGDGTFVPGRQLKRSKSENVSLANRYKIASGSLIFVKNDTRERDQNGKVIPPAIPLKKAYAPSSDLAQKDLVTTYYNNIDRTVISQSKSATHLFAVPDWTIMEAYLFPWIRANNSNPDVALTRLAIKHIAYRIWEYLINKHKVIIRHDESSRLENVPLGDVRGWWWESDGDLPKGFDAYDGHVPGTTPFIHALTDA